MVQPLNQTQGYTQVGQAEPLALAKTEVTPDLVKQTDSPSILSTEPPAPPQSSQDLSQAAQVAPVDSGNAPSAATATTPTVQTNSFASNLGNILSSILQPTEADKSTGQAEGTGNTDTSTAPKSEQKNTPVVEPQKEEAPVPGLEGYKSVLPSVKGEGVGDRDRAAIRTIESGSAKGNYQAVGKETRRGDRAYGAYQMMGANIPGWTRKYLGKTMTPHQFLQDSAAQDKVFAGEFGRLKQKYGGPGAAQAWFAGEAGMKHKSATDVNGTTVANYGRMYTKFY